MESEEIKPIEVTEKTADRIEPEMMHEFGIREGKALMSFLESAKCPALVVAAIDTVPFENGKYNIFRTALGSSEAILHLIIWLQSEVMPKLAAQNQG